MLGRRHAASLAAAIGAKVAVAGVVGDDQHDVGLLLLRGLREGRDGHRRRDQSRGPDQAAGPLRRAASAGLRERAITVHAIFLSPNDAAEADVARRGIDRLRVTRRRTVAAAVVGRAQMRAALQDPARDPRFRLAGIVALILAAAARVLGDAAGFRRVRRVLRRRRSRSSIPRHCRSCREGRSRWAGRP